MKKCSFCAEEIQDEAIKCRFCNSDLNEKPPVCSLEQKQTPDQTKYATLESDEKIWAVFSHLGGLIPFPLFHVLIPLFIWLTKGSDSEFIEMQSREALNFQISMIILEVVAVLVAITIIGAPLAAVMGVTIWFANLFCSIKGAFKTSRKIPYAYPLNFRLIGK